MLRDLRIKNFRGFREFSMSGLGRVNLLVGTNNSGKTSVLEAIHILSTPGNPFPLWHSQDQRGEFVDAVGERQAEVAHLVYGHKLKEGGGFQVGGSGTGGRQQLLAELVARNVDPSSHVEADEDVDYSEADAGPRALWLSPMSLRLDWTGTVQKEVRLPLSGRGGLDSRRLSLSRIANASEDDGTGSAVSFITTEGLGREEIVELFESVVLTPDENVVLGALRTIEPAIERIASVGAHIRSFSREARGGLAMMVAGQRIPIGSMGDGIWRMLGVALALVHARGGVLLVDEIDTGLHYSVLVDMWRLVLETARNLDVQVFATTHSRDCYEALAAVTEPGRTEISLQRIERGKVEAVAFSELEIRQAAERGLEVR